MKKVSTFIINLKSRPERKHNVSKEFLDKTIFNITIVDAIVHENGAKGLWQSIQHILKNLADDRNEFVLICEDDHQFTADYSIELLLSCIAQAKENNADVLCCGVSWFHSAIQVSENLFWTNSFTGTQFIILFKSFWNVLLEADFSDYDVADAKISSLSDNIFFTSPFISIQKDYGYSDVTSRNNNTNIVSELFKNSIDAIDILKSITRHYKHIKIEDESIYDLDKLTIPTYIINLPERVDRRKHIEQQFANRKEFEIRIMDAVKHEIGAVGLWLSIRRIVKMALENEDDVIIICEDDHEFTKDYSKDYLLRNIIEASQQGCYYLSGGTSKFRCAIPVSKNKYWVSYCLATQFIILYKGIFDKILEEPFDNTVVADLFFSNLITSKMILYPFVSVQKDFGYSDVTVIHTQNKSFVIDMFKESDNTMKKIVAAQKRFI